MVQAWSWHLGGQPHRELTNALQVGVCGPTALLATPFSHQHSPSIATFTSTGLESQASVPRTAGETTNANTTAD